MNNKVDVEKHLREPARRLILRVLYAGHPIGASEAIVVRILQDFEFEHAVEDVRREFDHLRSLGLAEAGQDELVGWYARLTAQGIAVVEHQTPAPRRIALPKKPRGVR